MFHKVKENLHTHRHSVPKVSFDEIFSTSLKYKKDLKKINHIKDVKNFFLYNNRAEKLLTIFFFTFFDELQWGTTKLGIIEYRTTDIPESQKYEY